MKFYDKNGIELNIGDTISPDAGRKLLIVSVFYVEDYQEECMFGQQIEDPLAFSVLTKDNLKLPWTKN